MSELEKERFALGLLKTVNEKREEIKKLTCEILELENDYRNAVKLKQNVQCILNAVAFCSNSNNNDLEVVKISAGMVLDLIRSFEDNDGENKKGSWGLLITHRLEDFCTDANSWNPVEFDFNKKGWKIEFKNLNIGAIINNK